jgi:hypothetical protein
MFQLAPVTISTHLHQLYGSRGSGIMRVFLRLVGKMIDRFLLQQINTKFYVKLSKSSHETERDTFNMIPKENNKVCVLNS